MQKKRRRKFGLNMNTVLSDSCHLKLNDLVIMREENFAQ